MKAAQIVCELSLNVLTYLCLMLTKTVLVIDTIENSNTALIYI